ncbi:hypothetical protein L873DRAFT_1149242 [Choiromyces venosus 120613-1]|uniref:Uncharacterized protein n=1 Tax=Choiromyces venosus 120613-1 TaxID=1336337 RepID=A0A3N4JK68_9PEZI|nr:hypothetical protein L873DRAFT_1149242 [Choiromyces venosus 120613-1]
MSLIATYSAFYYVLVINGLVHCFNLMILFSTFLVTKINIIRCGAKQNINPTPKHKANSCCIIFLCHRCVVGILASDPRLMGFTAGRIELYPHLISKHNTMYIYCDTKFCEINSLIPHLLCEQRLQTSNISKNVMAVEKIFDS